MRLELRGQGNLIRHATFTKHSDSVYILSIYLHDKRTEMMSLGSEHTDPPEFKYQGMGFHYTNITMDNVSRQVCDQETNESNYQSIILLTESKEDEKILDEFDITDIPQGWWYYSVDRDKNIETIIFYKNIRKPEEICVVTSTTNSSLPQIG